MTLCRSGCLALAIVLAASGSSAAPAACGSEAHRQFDFWLGEWQVSTPDGAGSPEAGRQESSPAADLTQWESWPTVSLPRPAPTSSSTPTTPSTGGSGARRRSRRRDGVTCRCCSRWGTPPVTGAAWSGCAQVLVVKADSRLI